MFGCKQIIRCLLVDKPGIFSGSGRGLAAVIMGKIIQR